MTTEQLHYSARDATTRWNGLACNNTFPWNRVSGHFDLNSLMDVEHCYIPHLLTVRSVRRRWQRMKRKTFCRHSAKRWQQTFTFYCCTACIGY